MAEIIALEAGARNHIGGGAARALRRQGRVPAVVYGGNEAPLHLTFDYGELWKHIQHGRFLSTPVDVALEGQVVRTIPRDIQFDPVRETVLHIDFLRVAKGEKITVDVPVSFINHEASPGLRRGGVLNVVRHEIEVLCPADIIPAEIEADLSGLEIGDSVHISAIALPEGVESTISDRDFTICTIAAPAGLADEAETEDEDAAEASADPATDSETDA